MLLLWFSYWHVRVAMVVTSVADAADAGHAFMSWSGDEPEVQRADAFAPLQFRNADSFQIFCRKRLRQSSCGGS
jgi:hypothetical protein